MDNFLQRLTDLINEISDGNVTDFAKKSGIKQATLFNYTKGRPPNAESLYNICNNLNISIDWLLVGKGERYIKTDVAIESKNIDAELLQTIIISIEEGLIERDLELAPVKKAELITLLYDHFAEADKKIDQNTVRRYLRLVA